MFACLHISADIAPVEKKLKSGVRVRAGGDGEAEAARAPERGADEVHGAHDAVHDAVLVLLGRADARELGALLEADADVKGARLGPLQPPPDALEGLVRANSDRRP